jgi:integrase
MDLRETYSGRKELWRSLRTSDRRTAALRLHESCAEIEAEFTRHRKGPPPREHFMRMAMAPLLEPSLTDQQKAAHIRAQVEQFAAMVLPETLHAHWVTQKRPREKSAAEGLQALKLLVGAKSCSTVTRADVVSARDLWLKKAAPGTVKKRLGLCGAIYQTALEDDKYIKSNPLADVSVRGARTPIKRRLVWTQEDFEKFHKAYPAGPLRDLLDLLQWTGARLGEITGLRPQDVKLKAAVPHLVIEPHEARELKNEESVRRVPLHPYVVEAAQRVAAGSLEGVTKDAWSKRLNRARQQLGIPHDIHTLRHGFKRAWRACGLPIDRANAIQGHADHSVSGMYGGALAYPLRPLAESLSKLRFDGE